jgi:hypothetical protein
MGKWFKSLTESKEVQEVLNTTRYLGAWALGHPHSQCPWLQVREVIYLYNELPHISVVTEFSFRFLAGVERCSLCIILWCWKCIFNVYKFYNLNKIMYIMWDFKFSRRRVWCSELSSGLYYHVKWLSTNVSEVRTASIISC